MFGSYFLEYGVIHHTYYAKTPQQNEVDERKNRYLLEVVHASKFSRNVPDVPQVQETVATSSPSLQRVGSFAKVITMLASLQGLGDERAGVEAISGEDGRAFKLKA